MVLRTMLLFEFRGASDAWADSLQSTTSDSTLSLDDVLSYASDDLGLEVDESGHLVLTEGIDFG